MTALLKIVAGIALAAASPGVGVPIETDGAGVIVEVSVNGEGPFALVLSASTGPLELSESLIAATGLRREDGGLRPARIALGGRLIEAVPVRPMEQGGPVLEMEVTDGMLPLGLLEGYLVTLDYRDRRLTIEEGELPPEDGVTIVSLDTDREGEFTAPLQVDGLKVTTRLLLGRNVNLTMGEEYSERLPLLTDREIAGYIQTPGGSRNILKARFSGPVRIGRQDLFVPMILFDPEEREASLGYVALRNHAVTLDQRRHRLRIVRTEQDGG